MRILGCLGHRPLVAACIAATLVACSEKTHVEVKPPVGAAVGSARALLVGNAAGATAPRAVSIGIDSRLLALGQDGALQTVSFVDQDGKTVDVVVDEVVKLSAEYVLLHIYYYVGKKPDVCIATAQVVLRVADGKLLVLGDEECGTRASGIVIDSATATLKGSNLYAIGGDGVFGGGILFRIELATLRAVPMNNPAYDPVVPSAGSMFAVDHDGNVTAPVSDPNQNRAKIFFADNRVPVLDGFADRNSYCDGLPEIPGNQYPSALATVYGEDGHLYVVCDSFAQDPDVLTTGYTDYYVRDVSFGATGRQFADVRVRRAVGEGWERAIDAANTYGMNTRSRYLLRTNWSNTSGGFFAMTPVPGGGVSLAWTDKALPAITVISGDSGYWRSGNSISRIKFDADSPAETVVTDPNLIGWNVVGGVVVYTSYLTGTSVGTYRVSTPGATPQLLLTSDMQVGQIVEL